MILDQHILQSITNVVEAYGQGWITLAQAMEAIEELRGEDDDEQF